MVTLPGEHTSHAINEEVENSPAAHGVHEIAPAFSNVSVTLPAGHHTHAPLFIYCPAEQSLFHVPASQVLSNVREAGTPELQVISLRTCEVPPLFAD